MNTQQRVATEGIVLRGFSVGISTGPHTTECRSRETAKYAEESVPRDHALTLRQVRQLPSRQLACKLTDVRGVRSVRCRRRPRGARR